MAVPTASNFARPAPPTLASVGHQLVRGASAVSSVPSFFVLNPYGSILLGGTLGVVYSETMSAQGGTPPYIYSITGGSLPPGLILTPGTGIISGTPTTAGNYVFTLKVVDINGEFGSQSFQIDIAAPSSTGGSFGWVA